MDPNGKRLNRVNINLNNSDLEPKTEEKKIGEARPRMLNDIFYPSRTIDPSCFNIPTYKMLPSNSSPDIPICFLSL